MKLPELKKIEFESFDGMSYENGLKVIYTPTNYHTFNDNMLTLNLIYILNSIRKFVEFKLMILNNFCTFNKNK